MDDRAWIKEIEKKVEEKRRNYKGPYCCLILDAGLSSNLNLLNYNVKYREYGIKIPKSLRTLIMSYCIYCGKKLPLSLRVKWANSLMQEYGLSDYFNCDKKKIPQEFLTDEWWKKRNL